MHPIFNIGFLNYSDKKVNYRNNGIKFVFRAKMVRVFKNKTSIKLQYNFSIAKKMCKEKII